MDKHYNLREGLLKSKTEKVLLAKEREKRKVDELKKQVKAKVDAEERKKAARKALVKRVKNHVKGFVFKTASAAGEAIKGAVKGKEKPSLALPPPLPAPTHQQHDGTASPASKAKAQTKLRKLPQIGKLNLKHQKSGEHENPDIDFHVRNHGKWLQAAHRTPDNNLIQVGAQRVNARQYYFAQSEHHRLKAADLGVTIGHKKHKGNLHVTVTKTTNPPPALAENVQLLATLAKVNKELNTEDIMDVKSGNIQKSRALNTSSRIRGIRKNKLKGKLEW